MSGGAVRKATITRHLSNCGRAALRLPHLRRQNEMQNDVNPARGGGQKIKKTLGGNEMKRRLLASLLTLVMMLSLLPTAVWAVDDEGSTSSGNGWPTGATGITVATEKYSATGEDASDMKHTTTSTSIWYKIDNNDTSPLAAKAPFLIIPIRLHRPTCFALQKRIGMSKKMLSRR